MTIKAQKINLNTENFPNKTSKEKKNENTTVQYPEVRRHQCIKTFINICGTYIYNSLPIFLFLSISCPPGLRKNHHIGRRSRTIFLFIFFYNIFRQIWDASDVYLGRGLYLHPAASLNPVSAHMLDITRSQRFCTLIGTARPLLYDALGFLCATSWPHYLRAQLLLYTVLYLFYSLIMKTTKIDLIFTLKQ